MILTDVNDVSHDFPQIFLLISRVVNRCNGPRPLLSTSISI
jgi:hypothetical protein